MNSVGFCRSFLNSICFFNSQLYSKLRWRRHRACVEHEQWMYVFIPRAFIHLVQHSNVWQMSGCGNVCILSIFAFAPHTTVSHMEMSACILLSAFAVRPIVVWRLFWWRASPKCFSLDLWITARIEIKNMRLNTFTTQRPNGWLKVGIELTYVNLIFAGSIRFEDMALRRSTTIIQKKTRQIFLRIRRTIHCQFENVCVRRGAFTHEIHRTHSGYVFGCFFRFDIWKWQSVWLRWRFLISLEKSNSLFIFCARSMHTHARCDFRRRRDAVAHQRMIFILLALTRT